MLITVITVYEQRLREVRLSESAEENYQRTLLWLRQQPTPPAARPASNIYDDILADMDSPLIGDAQHVMVVCRCVFLFQIAVNIINILNSRATAKQ